MLHREEATVHALAYVYFEDEPGPTISGEVADGDKRGALVGLLTETFFAMGQTTGPTLSHKARLRRRLPVF